MPKMKNKSSCKKRFKLTAQRQGSLGPGRQAPRHDQAQNKQIRNQRGTTILASGDERLVKFYMPFAR